MKNFNKVLSYILIVLCVVMVFAMLQLNIIKTCANSNKYSEFNEENILKYSRDYYENKYDKKNMYYIILTGGYECGHDFCIVRVKSKEDIKKSSFQYTCELKVYDNSVVLEN